MVNPLPLFIDRPSYMIGFHVITSLSLFNYPNLILPVAQTNFTYFLQRAGSTYYGIVTPDKSVDMVTMVPPGSTSM